MTGPFNPARKFFPDDTSLKHNLDPFTAAAGGNSVGAGGGGVLILDEFTSSVDVEREKTMGEIIWREFESYTIIMISHRLDLVMRFDRVMVMDQGRLVEEGSPSELIEGTGGRFKDLWMAGNLGEL